jgi:hypothetical protein
MIGTKLAIWQKCKNIGQTHCMGNEGKWIKGRAKFSWWDNEGKMNPSH